MAKQNLLTTLQEKVSSPNPLEGESNLRTSIRVMTSHALNKAKDFVDIDSDEIYSKVTEFIAGPLSHIKRVLDQTFDGPISGYRDIRRIALAQMNSLIAGKRAWSAPVLELERDLKKKMSHYLLQKELALETAERDLALDADLEEKDLWARLEAVRGNPQAEEQIYDLLDSLHDGTLEPDVVPVGISQVKIEDTDPRVSTRDRWTWEVTDTSLMKKEYMLPNKVAINRVVRQNKKRAEEVVGGIRVIRDKTIAVRKS